LKNESVKVHYVGRLLDGWVFDTNIADTARKYGIYDKSKDYSPLSVLHSEELKQMIEDNSLVEGFCMAVKEMSYGDKAFTMFYSEYGYGENGSSQIGPYQPLIFWLYIEPEDE
jgi:FKBP-type peptidyl-prolyl cis-trans isomerase